MNMKKGFTLIEIMIVVAIIAILAAVAIPNFISYRKTAQKNSCISTQNTIATAVEAYLVANPGTATIDINTAGQLWNANGTGFLKVTEAPKCPDGTSTYTVSIAQNTGLVTVTCSNSETEEQYKHKKATTTTTPEPAPAG